MKKTNGVGKPRNIVVQEKRRDDEETGYVVDEEWFLAYWISSIHDVLNGNLIDIEDAGEYQEDSC